MSNLLTPILVSLILFTSVAFGQDNAATAGSPDLVVHLLDYLAKDYGGAVQNGKVISKFEYAEQIEFAQLVEKNTLGSEKLRADSELATGIKKLRGLIESKGEATDVAKLARGLQQDVIRIAGIEVAPTSWPDLARGAQLYQQNCVTCHGAEARGDGPAGANLDPKPSNFHDSELAWNTAPYNFYNTIRLGVPGTGMPPFASVSDDDVWALAFYLKSVAYVGQPAATGTELGLTLKEVATLPDSAIATRLGGPEGEAKAAIASLRTKAGEPPGADPLNVAESLLNESLEAAKRGDFDGAEKAALRAYLEGIEPVEPKMKANLPGFVEQIEALMAGYRSSLSARDPIATISTRKADISNKLKDARKAFSANKMSPGVAFGAAFSIFLREGFEAVLIIIVLISILRAMGQPQAVKWVHIGWMGAVALGLVAWFASGVLLSMSGLSRELLEGAISLLAVAVLVYVGFWLHRYSEMKKWRAYLEAKLKHGLNSGSYVLLAVVAFMAVFREAFEVVLFLRAIWMDLDPSGQTMAGAGVLTSLVLLIGLAFAAVRGSRNLPITKLFQVCSWTMIVLALVLAGKGVHSLQEAGLVPISSLPAPPRIDLIGLYPSFQTLALQALVVAIFAFLFLNERRSLAPIKK